MEKIRMTIRLVPELNREVKNIAERQGKSKNSIIIDACWAFVKKMKRENKNV